MWYVCVCMTVCVRLLCVPVARGSPLIGDFVGAWPTGKGTTRRRRLSPWRVGGAGGMPCVCGLGPERAGQRWRGAVSVVLS